MIAWVFPGQGSQHFGMGESLASADAREIFEVAGEILGWDVRAVCQQGPLELISSTEVAQPAILTVSVATARTLEGAGLIPDVVAGHSVGEFAALVAAHAISFEDALRAVTVRAKSMAVAGQERPGAMAAILGLEAHVVEECCRASGGVTQIAASNAPAQCVISGEHEAVAVAAEKARAAGGRVIPLNVSVAAHSPLMEPAMPGFAGALRQIHMLEPVIPFVSCVSGQIEADPTRIVTLLQEALTKPVQWTEVVRSIEGLAVEELWEVGPGKVLGGLARRTAPSLTIRAIESDADLPTPARVR